MILYRYSDSRGQENTSYVHLDKFEVVRETPHTYVIDHFGTPKYVLKGNDGKRFAYASQEAARKSFKRRKEMQLGYLSAEHDRILALVHFLKRPDWAENSYKQIDCLSGLI